MTIYFLRHGDAVDGADDAVRPLSPRGRADLLRLGRFLKRAGIRFDAVYSSPLTRAVQTAEILRDQCAAKALAVTVADPLLNEARAAAFDRWLSRLGSAEHVLLSGHAPSLSVHLSRLLKVPEPTTLKLAKGALAAVEREPGQPPRLRLLLAPRHLPE